LEECLAGHAGDHDVADGIGDGEVARGIEHAIDVRRGDVDDLERRRLRGDRQRESCRNTQSDKL